MPARPETVAVALSGGVDSSAAAALMLEAGFEVLGLTMRLGDDDGPTARAAEVARCLGITHHVVDLRDVFRQDVLRPCWEEYARGRTPNPCVLCNPRIKLGRLWERARELGAQALATGHHARLISQAGAGAPVVARGRDPAKDQSYFLARLTPGQRRAARFPIGEMTKDQVRQLARDRGLPSAESLESQDTCVVRGREPGAGGRGPGLRREGAFAETLRRRLGLRAEPGVLVGPGGEVLGRHEGVHLFTIGQRRGLGVSLGRRAYVVGIDGARRAVAISPDPAALRSVALAASGVVWSVPPPRGRPLSCQVQIRYRHRPAAAQVVVTGESAVEVHFARPATAVTPGQAVVFYGGDRVLGCGWIDRTWGG